MFKLGMALAVVAVVGAGALVTHRSLSAQREPTNFRAQLTGFSEVPAIVTNANGSLTLQLTNPTTLSFSLTYTALDGAAPTAAHIHIGQTDVNGGVSAFFCGGGKDPCPVSGTVTGTIVPADVIGPAGQGVPAMDFARLLRAIRAGTTYVNVHTPQFPGGEIRGQIGAVAP